MKKQKETKTMKVRDIQNRQDLQFINDSQDVEFLREYFGNNLDMFELDSFFVKIEDGDYTEVYGIEGIVPNLEKTLFKIQ